MRTDLPSGTVTFLFTDVEGSTKLLHELGAEEYSRVLVDHRRVLREAFAANQGVEVDTQGDAFFVAFPTAPGALRAAAEALDVRRMCGRSRTRIVSPTRASASVRKMLVSMAWKVQKRLAGWNVSSTW